MVILLMVFAMISVVDCLDNGLARTPPMGWLSWERFLCETDCELYPDSCINERLYMEMADRMVDDGYLKAGYQYVDIDDCWSLRNRGSDGKIVADPKRFPSGIKGLADFVHGRGLKLGIYGDVGNKTCARYPGSFSSMELDAQTFADWGVDSLKFDGCNIPLSLVPEGFQKMATHLNKTGRPILYNCKWPANFVFDGKIPDYKAVAKSCNLWRNFYDISDSWDSVKSVIEFYRKDQGNFRSAAGPGGFNDPDMLMIGNFGLSEDQSWIHMAMWSMLAAPLLMSNDLRKVSDTDRQILQHPGLIKIDQDPLGIPAKCVAMAKDIEIWTRPIIPKGSLAIAFLNLKADGDHFAITIKVSEIGLTSSHGYNVTNVITGEFVQFVKPADSLKVTSHPQSVVVYTANPI